MSRHGTRSRITSFVLELSGPRITSFVLESDGARITSFDLIPSGLRSSPGRSRRFADVGSRTQWITYFPAGGVFRGMTEACE